MEKTKTSRESETRTKQARKKDWTPPSSLDAPAAPQGYAHRWIRTATAGFEDAGNVSKKLREGWEFVKAETILKSVKTITQFLQKENMLVSLELVALCWQGYQRRF